MLTQAQCEKAVTNSEPMGRPRSGNPSLEESKSVTSACFSTPGSLKSFASELIAMGAFYPIFNGLEGSAAEEPKRKGSKLHHYRGRQFIGRLGEWFGPSFVTIFATGVRLCST